MSNEQASKNEIRNQNLTCKQCGTNFVCTSGPPGSCWCNYSPNLLEGFDLAGECLCPDCLALGKREAILAKRENNFAARRAVGRKNKINIS